MVAKAIFARILYDAHAVYASSQAMCHILLTRTSLTGCSTGRLPASLAAAC